LDKGVYRILHPLLVNIKMTSFVKYLTILVVSEVGVWKYE